MPPFDSEYEEKLYNDRLASLNKIAAIGERLGLSHADATYPNAFPFTHTIPELRALGDPLSAEELEAQPIEAGIAGRIMAHRAQGKAGFAQLQGGGWTSEGGGVYPTGSAQRIQIYLRKDDVGPDPATSDALFELYKLLHLGDIIGVRGTLMRTRTGELTLKVHSIHLPGQSGKPALQFLSKAMLALPDKYHGLEDVELRYRQRYVDLIMNSGTLPKSEASNAPTPDAVILSEQSESKDPRILPGSPQTSEEPTEPRNVREVFVKRAQILRAIRRFFDARGYLEVETPMMQTIAGGAAARPFKTHHNALDIPLSLRIAPELYLKRLVVGGLDRVYEINRNFRNEGVSTQHNPEFTMLEFYQAYANYHDLMELTQELITYVAKEVNGSTITYFNGNEIDLNRWQKLSMREAIIKFWPVKLLLTPLDLGDLNSAEALYSKLQLSLDGGYNPATEKQVDPSFQPSGAEDVEFLRVTKSLNLAFQNLKDRQRPLGKIIAEVFEAVAEPHLIQPTIIYDFPLAVSPLSKIKPDEPDWVERFEFYIGGFEVGNAFSELNDPDDQRRRFEDQLKERDRGDDEAHAMDEDYVRALSFGLPPTAGEGIGIDRLTMILTGARSIRDVILFPLMRPQPRSDDDEHMHGESAE